MDGCVTPRHNLYEPEAQLFPVDCWSTATYYVLNTLTPTGAYWRNLLLYAAHTAGKTSLYNAVGLQSSTVTTRR